ncbi:M24 family metallopeptidase [Bradyrhizobium diversitatis]|uniref:M24 family metallopeptidase n=1 Tax=Bradyrhizobium diversitatis TaxID=2755406 RepID=A0ABS0PF82_9BRAD|nr:Xaa-Pro peptidase family protein [Bradyrhizobium diversitatis]MBH5391868.1 M24 family metallopeptidase [Bradyrhizobium diversitatis]
MAVTKALQPFPKSEYLRRLIAVKAEMARRGIDALLVTSTSNITYLTGNVSRLYSIHGLLVMGDKAEPTMIVRAMDAAGCLHLTYLEPGNVIGYSDDYVGRPDQNGYDVMIDFIHEAGYANRSVGIEFNAGGALTLGVMTVATAEKFKARLENAQVVDATKLVDWVRLIKSDLEINVLRDAAAIADAAIMRAAEVIRPGVHESEVAAEIMAAQVRGAPGGKPATGAFAPLICSSPRTGTAHIVWSDDELRKGSQINIELSGNRHNYYAAIMRTFTIGPAPDRVRRLHEAQVAGLEAALAVARPGHTCSDVANAFYRTMGKMGFRKDSRCGYPIGIDWAEPTVSLQSSDSTELKPNMAFHLMLGNWLEDDFGYVISESFRVTGSNVEVLTKAPRKLFEL